MAITPEEVQDAIEEKLSLFEIAIDQALKNVSMVQWDESVRILIPLKMDKNYFYTIKERYISAGWENVRWVEDKWLDFFIKKNK